MDVCSVDEGWTPSQAKTMGNSSALLSTEIRNSDRIAGKPVVTVVTSQLHSSAFPEGI
jgi:hypothetical protein